MFESIHPLLAFGAIVALGAPLFAAIGWKMRPLLVEVPAPATREIRPSAQSAAPALVRPRGRARAIRAAATSLVAHLACWVPALVLAAIPSFLIAQSADVAALTSCQRDLWFVVPQPLAFGLFLAALGLGVRAAPSIDAVPPLVRVAVRSAALLALGIAGAVLFLGGENGDVLPPWAWLLVKGGVVAFLAHKLGNLARDARPETIRRLSWTVALPLGVLNLAALIGFIWLEGYGS